MSSIDWSAQAELSERWCTAGREYAAAINAFVAKGTADGWDAAGPEPEELRSEADARAVLALVEQAQAPEDRERVRAMFPPMFAELVKAWKNSAAWIGPVVYVAPGVILARRGDAWAETRTWELREDGSTRLHVDLRVVGRSPQRRVVALGREEGVELRLGWNGEHLRTLPWPNGSEGVPAGRAAVRFTVPRQLDEIIPFDDGERAVLVSSAGVFLLAEDGARLLYPDPELMEALLGLPDRGDDPLFRVDMRMQHAGVSPDGKLIAVGAQDGRHLVLNADSLEVVARVGPHGEYPHRAWFSEDGQHLALNACHFFNGQTIRVPTRELPGMDTKFYEADPRITPVHPHARVYGAVGRGTELILGDAYGYLDGVCTETGCTWRHFVGNNITGMDLSPDGKQLAVGTMSGVVHVLGLDVGEDLYRIGTSTHGESRRWLFLEGEAPPLMW